jgi:hypothetical protein
MTHLGSDLLMGYARRTLDAEALLLADGHLSSCTECRGRLVDDEGLRTTVRSLRRDLAAARQAPTSHLPYDQIEARAEGRLRGAAREVAETHLEHCAPCAAQARDLEEFATAFRDARPRATIAGAAAAAAGYDLLVGAGTTFATGTGTLAGEKASAPGDSLDGSRDEGARSDPKEDGRGGARPTFRLSDEAAAEASRLPRSPLRMAVPASLTAIEPERSRATMAVLILVGGVLLAGLGFGGRAAFRKVLALKGRVQELERSNEKLQEQAAAAGQTQAATEPGSGPQGAAGAAVPGEAGTAPQTAPTAGTDADAAAPVQARRELTIRDRKGPVGLDAEGDLVGFDGLPMASGKVLAAALRRGSVEVPDEIRSLASRAAAPEFGEAGAAGASETAMTLATANGTFVRGTRPALSWGAVEGATQYRAALFDAGGTLLSQAGPMRGTTWTVPRPLQRGQVYQWRVVALRPVDPATLAASPPAAPAAAQEGSDAVPGADAVPATEPAGAPGGTPPAVAAVVPAVVPAAAPRGPAMERIASGTARFKVLSTEESAALERGLRSAPGSRLLAGVLEARAGLLDDAERDLRALAADNPDSDVARGLLASVEGARIP